MKKVLLVIVFMLAAIGGYFFYYPKIRLAELRKDLKSDKLNVVFLMIDTLRADHLPFYGFHRNTAPFLSELAEKSVVFDRAISASAWTVPSIASIFTSKSPTEHGVLMGFFATQKLKEANKKIELNRIPSSLETMATYFSANGYKTIGVTDNWNISEMLGYDQGFQLFQNYSYKSAEVVNPKVEEFLSQVNLDEKYFLYLHYMDVHSPYKLRKKWYVAPKNADKKTQVVARYDSNIGYVDSKFKELYDKYKWGENAIIVIVSDHGEAFWEHGVKGHGKTLYNEETHVPLLIVHPNIKKPTRVEDPVGHIDLLPTLADILELPKRDQWSGHSLLPVIAGAEKSPPTVLSELLFLPEYKKPQYQSFLKERTKVLKFVDEPGKYQLFDWYDDPKEAAPNTVDGADPMADEMEGYLKSLNPEEREKEEFELHEEALDHLKTLGYVQ